MQVRVLGGLEVIGPSGPADLGGARQRAVLAVLLLHPNEVVSVDRLVDDVWSGEPPPSAVATLQRYVSHLRRAIDGSPLSIETRRPGYVAVVDPDAVDARRFERLAEEGATLLAAGDPARASATLGEALALWRGRPLPELADESFAAAEIGRLDELRMVVLEHRLEAELALGRHADLVPELERLVADHPLRERFRGQLMRALHGAGRRADALRTYRDAREVFAEELGLDPSIDLQRLEEAILLEDPAVQHGGVRVVTGNLPVEVTPFVGRSAEVAHVEELLGRARLVTLTGPGGTGKTRLALRTAAELAPTRAAGAWLVELAPLSEGSSIDQAVATVFGVRSEADRPLLASLVDALRGRHALLILDNCEHLLSAAAALAAELLRTCPRLQILATSREPLDVAGEVAWGVPTLPVPPEGAHPADIAVYDAVVLFAERAAASFPGFSVTADNAAAVGEVCRRLDGIPLALELAAARLRVLTVAQLAERLGDRFNLLTGGSRAALPRQRTLRAAVEWSYDLLSAGEQALFTRLSVFAGTFTLDAAEHVAGAHDAAVLDLLGGLVAKSLVARVDDGADVAQYRLLETLREYGAERLPAVEVDEVRSRHAAYFSGVVETAIPLLDEPHAPAALDRLDAAQQDVRAALAWLLEVGDVDAVLRLAGRLRRYWDYRSRAREGRAWLERALALDPGPTPERLTAMVAAAQMAWLEDDLVASKQWCEEALALASVLGEAVDGGRALVILAELARHLESDSHRSMLLAAEAEATLAAAGDRWWQGEANRVMALVSWDRGDLTAARRFAERCLEVWGACGDAERTAGARCLLAGFARARGDLGEARDLYEQGLNGFSAVGEPVGVAMALRGLGGIAALAGDHERALRLGEQSLRVLEELGHGRSIAESLKLMADACLELGDLDRAAELCRDAVARFRERGFAGDLVPVLASLARITFARGDLDEAARICEEGLVPYREAGYKREAAPLLCLLGLIRAQGGDPAAVALCEESLQIFEELGDRRGMAQSLEALARAATTATDDLAERALAALVEQWRLDLRDEPDIVIRLP